jgi:hypothetical protein
MPDEIFTKGTIFIDKKATSIQGIKPKYFIGLNNANEDDDKITCFVFNTENFPDKLIEGCNKEKEKFYLPPDKFSFLPNHTVIMLNRAVYYKLEEILTNTEITILETVSDILARQIKNCIDKNNIEEFGWNNINQSFKILK